MRKNKVLWISVIVISMLILIGYVFWAFSRNRFYDSNYYNNRGMMGRRFNYNNSNQNTKKLPIDEIENIVEEYINDYGRNLHVSDIFVYKDTDYYISIEEENTKKGAMELLVNPYTGQVYPEYGPNMMWNEKYSMHGGYGMMGRQRQSGNKINKNQAVNIADEYVKNNLGEDFSVNGEGHEFYGYFTFHINKKDTPVGMMSVNYYTGDVWYHDWHGQLERVVSHHDE